MRWCSNHPEIHRLSNQPGLCGLNTPVNEMHRIVFSAGELRFGTKWENCPPPLRGQLSLCFVQLLQKGESLPGTTRSYPSSSEGDLGPHSGETKNQPRSLRAVLYRHGPLFDTNSGLEPKWRQFMHRVRLYTPSDSWHLLLG